MSLIWKLIVTNLIIILSIVGWAFIHRIEEKKKVPLWVGFIFAVLVISLPVLLILEVWL